MKSSTDILSAATCVNAAASVGAASLPRENKEFPTPITGGRDASATLGSTAMRDASATRDKRLWTEYRELFFGRVQKWLDLGFGDCPFADRDLCRIVEDAIMHFNGVRYVVYAYVVMPNHVHVLFMPFNDVRTDEILHSWKSYTSLEINRRRQRKGNFWQKESWDHLVRNERQFTKFVDYIKMNDLQKAWSVYDE